MSLTAPFTWATLTSMKSYLLYYGTSPLGVTVYCGNSGIFFEAIGLAVTRSKCARIRRLFHRKSACFARDLDLHQRGGGTCDRARMGVDGLAYTGSRAIAYGLALAFACANASSPTRAPAPHTCWACSYVSASVLARLPGRRAQRDQSRVGMRGGSHARAAVPFWLPYVLSVPGVVVLGVRRQIGSVFAGGHRENVAFVRTCLGTFALSVILCLTLVLAARRIQSVAERKLGPPNPTRLVAE